MNRYTVTVMSDQHPRTFLVVQEQLGDLVETIVALEMAHFEVTAGWQRSHIEDTVLRVKVGENWEHHFQTHAAHAAKLVHWLAQRPGSDGIEMVAISQYGLGHVIASNRTEYLGVGGHYLAPAPIPA